MRRILADWIWLLLFCALAFGFIIGGWSASKQISPQQQREASHSNQTSSTKPDGSAAAPFAVQVIPSPKSAEERAQEAEEREEKKSADRWLVRWTAALFAATVGLILATGVLGYFGLQQSRDMKASINAAEKAADAAMLGAKAAIGLELPIIGAHAYQLIDPDGIGPAVRIVEDIPPKKSFLGRIDFSNSGRNRGFPFELAIGWTVDSLPDTPIYNEVISLPPEQIVPESIELEPHKTLVFGLGDYHRIELTEDQIEAIRLKEKSLRFYCAIRYRDFIQFEHEACFVWRYEEWPNTTSFIGWRFTPERDAPQAYTRHT